LKSHKILKNEFMELDIRRRAGDATLRVGRKATVQYTRRLGGVVAGVLATGPKGREFELIQGDGF
jgi:hypothetical protein